MYFEIVGTTTRLLGSMHQWPVESGPRELPAWVWDGYQWSEQLYLEADLADAGGIVRLSAGDSLQQYLPASIWAALQRVTPPGMNLAVLKPWAALMTLQVLGKTMVEGVEPQLSARAHADKKPIRHLETMAEFNACVQGATSEEIWQAFTLALENLHGIREVLNDLYAAWLSRRVGQVAAVLPRTLLGLPVVARLILDDRNLAWLKVMKAAIEAETRNLIVVGAAHLPGTRGVLALLDRAGYGVRPLPESA
jgi:uncharacterized protein YbaP (TraB family)